MRRRSAHVCAGGGIGPSVRQSVTAALLISALGPGFWDIVEETSLSARSDQHMAAELRSGGHAVFHVDAVPYIRAAVLRARAAVRPVPAPAPAPGPTSASASSAA